MPDNVSENSTENDKYFEQNDTVEASRDPACSTGTDPWICQQLANDMLRLLQDSESLDGEKKE